MKVEELYKLLDSTDDLKDHERALRTFLCRQLERYEEAPEVGDTLAYEVAGLMSARSVVGLPDDNPYMEIMLLAGELELPAAHHSPTTTWDRFAMLVRALPHA
jgi:hypothetical protein